MGNRLSNIYTRTGDDGATGLADGTRVDKDSDRVHAFGDIDELNSLIGVLISGGVDGALKDDLLDIQHVLFDLGGELALPEQRIIGEENVRELERRIDSYNAVLPPLREFILPGGSSAAAMCHYARTVCRRAERQYLALSRREMVNPASLKWLNRLSDLLFVMARTLARRDGGEEVLWRSERLRRGHDGE